MTKEESSIANFVAAMDRIQVIGFNHNTIDLDAIGSMHISPDHIYDQLSRVKEVMNFSELVYLSTCNRVEFYLASDHEISKHHLAEFFTTLYEGKDVDFEPLSESAKIWTGINAVNHIIEVASSIDSMVIGEREIITQIKSAFDFSQKSGLSGDLMRLVEKQTIQTAKKVYNSTFIANKSVSVVGLAFKELMEIGVNGNSNILVVGAGATNKTMCKLLCENGVKNFTIFNRSVERGEALAKATNGKYFPLSELKNYTEPWDILVTCTASESAIITDEIYSVINPNDRKKVIVDMAIPNDVDPVVIEKNDIDYISIQHLKEISSNNLNERKKELLKVRQIIYEGVESFKDLFERREIERKLHFIPKQLKSIRERATQEIFSKDLESLDDRSKEVLDKVLNYMEKKYVGVPMKMAKELLTDKEKKK
ncbi:MAG: glutamyl-tRNA reductase [Crocinitomicaceae bacterium]|nr:glutamyl-tRNA reductase [Crocinitomicaceae bacterium]